MNELETATCSTAQASTLLVIATYNEMDNLPQLVDQIHAALADCHILVVDDNSPDGTGRWCRERAATDARLRCLHRSSKQGLGTATIAGLRYAIDHRYERVVTMDADLSHDPSELPAMLAMLDGKTERRADVVIGSRYVPGGRIEGWPWSRRWMSRWINIFARWWLKLPVRDASGAFRCYHTDTLRRINLDRVRARGYAVCEELLWDLHRHEARLAERPITFVNRRHGHSKISATEAVTSLWHMVLLPWRS